MRLPGENAKVAADDRKYPVKEGQVGIRCENLPLSAEEQLESLKSATSSLSSVLR
jgi:hypothetical protein